MAEQGIINGTNIKLFFASGLTILSTSTGFSVDHKLRDTTVFDSMNWKEQIPGDRSFSLETEGYLAYNRNNGTPYGGSTVSSLLTSALMNQDKIMFMITPGMLSTGDLIWYGNVYLTGAELSAPNEDNTTYNLSFNGAGALGQTYW